MSPVLYYHNPDATPSRLRRHTEAPARLHQVIVHHAQHTELPWACGVLGEVEVEATLQPVHVPQSGGFPPFGFPMVVVSNGFSNGSPRSCSHDPSHHAAAVHGQQASNTHQGFEMGFPM